MSDPSRGRWATVLLATAAIAIAGCGESAPTTYPVAGLVRFDDGQPVQTGHVEFHHAESGISAKGRIGADGSFALTTFREGDGAVAGVHRVTVHQLILNDMVRDPSSHRHGRSVPSRYADQSSPLTATVLAADRTQTVELILDGPKG